MNEVMTENNVPPEEAGIHSGATETSLMLCARENLVQKERMEKGYIGKYYTSTLLSKGLKSFSDIGVLGDPKKASKEAGKEIISRWIKDNIERIQIERGNK